jgi:hypothetical protein
MVNMNMIVNASDLVGYEAENKTSKGTQKEMLAKLVAVWEKRNSKQAKKIGTFGLLAVSLAACMMIVMMQQHLPILLLS